ncbi:MAG TPA: phosphoribosylamine--glycine ligase, partial [Burkholderiaceae bacterium]|nr:phosphoribosylamine--glycine ligase [Burkholderiaceae bacterium]
VKADGLAAGKGVIVAETLEQAHRAIDSMLDEGSFGQAGARVVIEEFLEGEEASFIVMCDGETIVPMASSQDHKRLLDNDQGPNTGGMGAYSPTPVVSAALHQRIMTEVIEPTILGMRAEGIRFTGFLYAGLMIGPGPDASRSLKVLEYNCRMGDPEGQPIIMRLQSDLVDILEHAVNGSLDQASVQWDPRPALGVVIAAGGYPEHPRVHDPIGALPPDTADCMVFHAGTELHQGTLRTSGGRVLCVTALGDNLQQARDRAYQAIQHTDLPHAQYRQDIAWRALRHPA